jgi:multidrug efflux pump subunit AcrA (membrane-fusion protein)
MTVAAGMGGAGALASLLEIEEHALKARNATQLAFVMVNDTRALAEYRQAALHVAGQGVVAVSGVSSVEGNAPFTLFLRRVFRAHEAGQDIAAADRDEWGDWLPPRPLFLALEDGDGNRLGTLLLARDEDWDEGAAALLRRLADVYAFAWAARHRPAPLSDWRRRLAAMPRWKWAAAAAAVLVLILPVRLSVLAPAEIVPLDPAVIRAPLEGVIETVLVRPNQDVAAGDILFDLDRTTIAGKLEVAAKALDTAKAELDQATQQAFFDPKAKATWAVIKARVDEKQAERAQLEDLMARAQVKSPRDGVAVMDDASEWIGRPVTVGEKVLAVADPRQVEMEAWLAPADLIALEPGGPVTVFLNTDPLAPVSATLSYVAFEATLQPDGLLAHRVRARIAGDASPRIGLKGTARLDGERVPLVHWLFRRPLAVIRQFLGR